MPSHNAAPNRDVGCRRRCDDAVLGVVQTELAKSHAVRADPNHALLDDEVGDVVDVHVCATQHVCTVDVGPANRAAVARPHNNRDVLIVYRRNVGHDCVVGLDAKPKSSSERTVTVANQVQRADACPNAIGKNVP